MTRTGWTTGIAVVIPCYKVTRHIKTVLEGIGPEVDRIYVVDDRCPEGSGQQVERETSDPRVEVLFNEVNEGVGGATLRGMRKAFADGAAICVKIDGDGQMDTSLLRHLVAPLERAEADYTKANRFFELAFLRTMPASRVFGNAVLSFFSKVSSGYWDTFDPTNGYVAIHRTAFLNLDIDKIRKRFFFESDLLFRLYIVRAVVIEIPMPARYHDEKSNLNIFAAIAPFLLAHLSNFVKRVFYTYFLRDFSIASIYLIAGFLLCGFGVMFGTVQWATLSAQGIEATSGTVMLSALPILLGFQLLLSFLSFDINNVPRYPLQRRTNYGRILPAQA